MYVILITTARVAGANDAESDDVANKKYAYTYVCMHYTCIYTYCICDDGMNCRSK